MSIAETVSLASSCNRKKVGCIIVKENNIISIGYNGTITGFDNVCELPDGTTSPEVLHAESNAILKCAKNGSSCDGADLYVTLSPCLNCAKMIIQAGIKKVYYSKLHSCHAGLELLEKAGVGNTLIIL